MLRRPTANVLSRPVNGVPKRDLENMQRQARTVRQCLIPGIPCQYHCVVVTWLPILRQALRRKGSRNAGHGDSSGSGQTGLSIWKDPALVEFRTTSVILFEVLGQSPLRRTPGKPPWTTIRASAAIRSPGLRHFRRRAQQLSSWRWRRMAAFCRSRYARWRAAWLHWSEQYRRRSLILPFNTSSSGRNEASMRPLRIAPSIRQAERFQHAAHIPLPEAVHRA